VINDVPAGVRRLAAFAANHFQACGLAGALVSSFSQRVMGVSSPPGFDQGGHQINTLPRAFAGLFRRQRLIGQLRFHQLAHFGFIGVGELSELQGMAI